MAELGAFFGNPNIQRQGARARALAGQRDVNTLADPRTYAIVQGLLGTAPDQMGFSVLNPDYEKIRKAAEPAFALGLLGQAAPLLAPMTKGLPVGATIKPININKGIYKPDLTMEEMLKVRDIPTVERVKQSIDLVGEKEFEKLVNTQFKKYKPSSPDQEAMLVESVTLQVLGKAQRSPFPQKEALDTAQRNAALPVEEGGLGLPKDNTPEMRAEAMGFDLQNPQYHATNVPEDFTSIRPSARGKMGAGIYTSPEAKYAEKYGGNQDVRILPLVSKGEYADADTRENIFDTIRGELYQKNPNFTSQELNNAVSQEMQRKGFSGFDVDKERLTFSPDQMRSRFAAFDPFRATTETASTRGVAPPDLLAGVLPLGLLADEEQRKKLYELMPSLLGQ
jgi:hypothetical protein